MTLPRHTGGMPRNAIPVFLACVLALLLPAPVSAQDGDVHVDPDSPTGREYDIPLERARRDATSKPEADAPYRSRSAPLFGEGIDSATGDETPSASSSGAAKPGSGGSSKPGSGGSGASERRETRKSRHAQEHERALPRTVEAAIKQPGAPARDGKSLLLVGVVAAGLVGLGVAAGTVARKRR